MQVFVHEPPDFLVSPFFFKRYDHGFVWEKQNWNRISPSWRAPLNTQVAIVSGESSAELSLLRRKIYIVATLPLQQLVHGRQNWGELSPSSRVVHVGLMLTHSEVRGAEGRGMYHIRVGATHRSSGDPESKLCKRLRQFFVLIHIVNAYVGYFKPSRKHEYISFN